MMQKLKIMICMGSSCFARGNEDNLRLIEDYIREHQFSDRIDLSGRCCAKQCAEGPNISIDGVLYNRISKEQLLKLLDEKFGKEDEHGRTRTNSDETRTSMTPSV